MSKADISLIVPIYNAEKYLDICINSLIHQTKKELEIILINDGSTDRSEEIIKKYNDKRIKYFKNKNQGIGKTRNFGIEKATGKYIMFVDSDDYLEIDACNILFNKAEQEKLDMVVFDISRIYSEERKEEKTESFVNTKLRDNPNLLNIINLGPCNKLFLTKLILDNNIRFVEDLKYEDVPFIVKCIDKSRQIGKVSLCLYNYVIHDNSETTIRDERCFDIIEIVKIIRMYFKEKKYVNESLNRLTVRIITNYTIQQRCQENINVGMKFIDVAFDYLEKTIPDYKNKKYYEGRGIRQIIEKSKYLTKIYCKLYRRLMKK